MGDSLLNSKVFMIPNIMVDVLSSIINNNNNKISVKIMGILESLTEVSLKCPTRSRSLEE